MARYIDAEQFLKSMVTKFKCIPLVGVSKYIWGEECFEGEPLDALINEQPTADVGEVKHGKWIVSATEFGWNCCEYPVEYTCSVCGRTERYEEPYCHCGAKMDGERRKHNG